MDTEPHWQVWRFDDNGHSFLVAECLTRAEAEEVAARFEARAHKQAYVARPAAPRDGTGSDERQPAR